MTQYCVEESANGMKKNITAETWARSFFFRKKKSKENRGSNYLIECNI